MVSKLTTALVLMFLLLLGGVLFLKAPLQTHNMQKTDAVTLHLQNIRSTFQAFILIQKAQLALQTFDNENNFDALYQASKYLDHANHFLKDSNFQKNSNIQALRKQIDTLSIHLQNSIADPSSIQTKPTQMQLFRLNRNISNISESVWETFEKEVIQLQYSEKTLLQQYKFIILTILLIALALGWFAKRQYSLSMQLEARKKRLHELAYCDMLTKIPNRKKTEQLIANRIRKVTKDSRGFYIALIDLDDFKNVNDLHNHLVGDMFLIECVKKIQSCLRVDDLVGRFGGDEFLVLFDDVLDVAEVKIVLERINKTFAQPIFIDNTQHHTSASIGVVHYPDNATTVQQLIKLADITMYQAKRLGKGRYIFFDKKLVAKLEHQHKIEPEIETALAKHQFELYYQPQIDAQTGKIVSAEALVRWNHPERGFITPDVFIPVIENGFMVKEFGEWVITQAAKQQKEFKRNGIDLTISVNLSIHHITMASFFDDMTTLVKKLNIDLRTFAFEVTEYKMIRYQERSIKSLNKLSEYGFRFKLDDFGTGYSSITYLHKMDFDAIKIDREFINEITATTDKAPLVDAIINMAQALELTIIAEGVETQEQLAYLISKGCNKIQGYYYAKPMSATAFQKFYKNSQTNL